MKVTPIAPVILVPRKNLLCVLVVTHFKVKKKERK